MLIYFTDLDEEKRQKCQTAGWIAMDPNNGDHLRKLPDHIDRYIFSMTGWARVIISNSDQDAIVQANKGLK